MRAATNPMSRMRATEKMKTSRQPVGTWARGKCSCTYVDKAHQKLRAHIPGMGSVVSTQ